jgi:hypothetical protein
VRCSQPIRSIQLKQFVVSSILPHWQTHSGILSKQALSPLDPDPAESIFSSGENGSEMKMIAMKSMKEGEQTNTRAASVRGLRWQSGIPSLCSSSSRRRSERYGRDFYEINHSLYLIYRRSSSSSSIMHHVCPHSSSSSSYHHHRSLILVDSPATTSNVQTVRTYWYCTVLCTTYCTVPVTGTTICSTFAKSSRSSARTTRRNAKNRCSQHSIL